MKISNRIVLIYCISCSLFISACNGGTSEYNAVNNSTAATTIDNDELNEEEHPVFNPVLDIDMVDEYREFLCGRIELENPYNPETKISLFRDLDYEENKEDKLPQNDQERFFALLDTNGDSTVELIVKINSYDSESLLILNSQDEKWTVYDVFETHTKHISFSINSNGIVTWGQNHTGDEEIYYCYNESGQPEELVHFISTEKWLETQGSDIDFCYEYYYLDGIESEPVYLSSTDEYEALILKLQGDQPNWYSLD